MSEIPGWTAAAIPAAVRLAAEAGTEVDEALEHLRPGGPVADMVVRLEQSAALTEVAADLAALLWAECEDVPRIAAILDEPAAQAALEAVAEARRRAAGRLADGAAPRPAAPQPAAQPRVASVISGSWPGPPPVAEAPAPVTVNAARPSPGGHQAPLPALTSVGGLGLRSAAGTAAAALVAVGRRLRRASRSMMKYSARLP